MLKKLLLITLIASFLILPNFFLAVEAIEERPDIKIDLKKITDNAGGYLYSVFLAMAILTIIVGAYFMLFSGGNPEKTTKGRKIVVWALIAVAIALLSKTMIDIVKIFFKP